MDNLQIYVKLDTQNPMATQIFAEGKALVVRKVALELGDDQRTFDLVLRIPCYKNLVTIEMSGASDKSKD